MGSDRILDWMKQQTRTWKLPTGLPAGVVHGNKTGELYDTENDVLIVWADSPYVLSVMTTGISYSGHAFSMMKEISRMTYEALN